MIPKLMQFLAVPALSAALLVLGVPEHAFARHVGHVGGHAAARFHGGVHVGGFHGGVVHGGFNRGFVGGGFNRGFIGSGFNRGFYGGGFNRGLYGYGYGRGLYGYGSGLYLGLGGLYSGYGLGYGYGSGYPYGGYGYGSGYGYPYGGYGYGSSYGYPYGGYGSGYGSSIYSYPSYNYIYPSSTYVLPPAGSYPNTTVPPAAAAPSEAPAIITVQVPANADVWFGDTKMSSSGTVRSYQSPPLAPNMTYSYTITAQWPENGQDVRRSKTIQVSAGSQSNVQFP